MPQIKLRLKRWEVPEGADSMVLGGETESGETIDVVFPAEQVDELVMSALVIAGVVVKKRNQNEKMRYNVRASGWEINSLPDGRGIQFSFVVRSGYEVSFSLPPEEAARLQEVLAVAVGAIPPPTPPGPTH